MKNFYINRIIFVFVLSFSIWSCSDQIVDNDLSFNEKVVVRSLLEAGKPIEVYFGKTFPPNSTFDPSKTFLEDVNVSIRNGSNIFPLEHIGDGIYVNNNLIAVNGEEYSLNAVWHGDTIKAQTYIPFSTTFQKAQVQSEISAAGDSVFYLQGFLTPRENAVYGATWSVLDALDTVRIEDDVIPNLVREKDANLAGLLLIKTRSIPNNLVKQYRNSLFIRIHAFDEVFYNYFITQDANNASTNIFSQSGINLRWNVTGNAIGLFIGKSDFIIKIP
ncbi:MAG: DUF4249 family protein [Melioribacteraceae bacterium]|nr:MAG: DUF4249 family protein [Melioribacteraceae bacterium]